MLAFLPAPLKGLLSGTLFALNTIFWCLMIVLFAIPKVLLPFKPVRCWTTGIMMAIGETWISCNDFNIRLTQSTKWDISGLEGLRKDRSYLLFANHQSWTDTFVLQHVFNRKIPFMRFFLKQELVYVPFLGLAWWALDFPFMKRYSAEAIARNPEKRGADLEATRKTCEKFRGSAISIFNFLEGTRFTPEKHQKQKSEYQHLLTPKAGGAAFVLGAMGDQFDSVLDVTIFYPHGAVSLGGALRGELHEVVVRVRKMPVPRHLQPEDYSEDESVRKNFQNWIREIWLEKDRVLDSLITRAK